MPGGWRRDWRIAEKSRLCMRCSRAAAVFLLLFAISSILIFPTPVLCRLTRPPVALFGCSPARPQCTCRKAARCLERSGESNRLLRSVSCGRLPHHQG
eukprot:6002049-Pyramimonas_sp.AAC.1